MMPIVSVLGSYDTNKEYIYGNSQTDSCSQILEGAGRCDFKQSIIKPIIIYVPMPNCGILRFVYLLYEWIENSLWPLFQLYKILAQCRWSRSQVSERKFNPKAHFDVKMAEESIKSKCSLKFRLYSYLRNVGTDRGRIYRCKNFNAPQNPRVMTVFLTLRNLQGTMQVSKQ
jgi:hypothetical protein